MHGHTLRVNSLQIRQVDKTGLSQSLLKSLIRKVIQRPCQQKQSAARSQAERPFHAYCYAIINHRTVYGVFPFSPDYNKSTRRV